MRQVKISKGFNPVVDENGNRMVTTVKNAQNEVLTVSVNVVSFELNNKYFYAITSMYLADKLDKYKSVEIVVFDKPRAVKCLNKDNEVITINVVCELKQATAGTADELKALI